jgi:hypothetical protein
MIAHRVRLQPSMQPKPVRARFIAADDGDRCRQPESDLRARDLFPDAIGRSSWNVANVWLLPKARGEPEFPGPLPELERQQQRRRDRRVCRRLLRGGSWSSSLRSLESDVSRKRSNMTRVSRRLHSLFRVQSSVTLAATSQQSATPLAHSRFPVPAVELAFDQVFRFYE